MKFYIRNSKKEETEKVTTWEAFVNHIDSIYFPGAAESLAEETILFEYENF